MDDNFELYKLTMRKMMHIVRLHRSVFERNISKMGIHHSQHHLLMYIALHGEINSQKEIAEKFGISSAAIARSLKELESGGYITKMPIEDDSRYNKIVITEKGKEIAKESHRMFKETDESVFKEFSEEDFLHFNACLDKMETKLREKNEESCCMRKSK